MDQVSPSPSSAHDKPWVMRTYSGHSTAKASNQLYRTNLAKGQTGLSIAFDLPTQIGYDPDSPEAAGEVGKVGVPVAHLGHMAQLLDHIPVESMNTSMTINATAGWLLGLYIANAEDNGVDPRVLSGTTQNDIVKEYLSRGTFIFPPLPAAASPWTPSPTPSATCPGGTPSTCAATPTCRRPGPPPAQEVAYALATAIGVLDAVQASGQIPAEEFPSVVGRISFFVNAGVRFVEETCKMRAFTELWDRVCAERYGVTDPKLRRMRYGVQVNSLGLTEAQPENNVPRIVLEALGVTLSKKARARALQFPAWNEALGLPHPGTSSGPSASSRSWPSSPTCWSTATSSTARWSSRRRPPRWRRPRGPSWRTSWPWAGPFRPSRSSRSPAWWAARPAGPPHRDRRAPGGRRQLLHRDAASPLASADGGVESILRVDPAVESELRADVEAWRATRDSAAVGRSLDALKRAAEGTDNVMPATIALAHAGGTTGEWAAALREVFGEYGPPPASAAGSATGVPSCEVLARSRALAARTGGPAQAAGGQARPRRTLQRRRADRRGRTDAGFEVV